MAAITKLKPEFKRKRENKEQLAAILLEQEAAFEASLKPQADAAPAAEPAADAGRRDDLSDAFGSVPVREWDLRQGDCTALAEGCGPLRDARGARGTD